MLKKFNVVLCLLFIFAVVFCGCGKKEISEEDKVDILLITDFGTINDGSYNQAAWEGVEYFANSRNLIAKYYQPAEISTEAYLEQIKIGVENGASIIVCPGELFGEAIFKAQKQYKNTKFIIVDGYPHNEDYSDETIGTNVMAISFAEEEAGFLAGYAAVRDGYTNLAFMGGVPEDTVIRYGYGYVQGADYAAIQMGVPVSVRYTYCNTFNEDTSVEATAGSWYDNDTEVIFACGGTMGNSVIRAAESHGGKVIGVDVDQSLTSDTVITSAMKCLDSAVYSALETCCSDEFVGGEIQRLTAYVSGVKLPMETSRFRQFNQEEYDNIYYLLLNGFIEPYAETNIGTCEELSLINTEVTYIVP